MKPTKHLIWAGSKWHYPGVFPDTTGLPIYFCEVARMKPRWRAEKTLGAAVSSSIVSVQSAVERTGVPYVFFHGFADEQSGGQDGIMTEKERLYWDEWASRFVSMLERLKAGGEVVPETIVFDHPRYRYDGRIRRNPVEKDWIERTLLDPLRAIGIECGIYGSWSGTTYWRDPLTTEYGIESERYHPVNIPWFIAPWQWRPNGGVVTPEEYKRSMRTALRVGYPSRTWAHWCDAKEMDFEDWADMVKAIREVHEGEKIVEPNEPADPGTGFDFQNYLKKLAEQQFGQDEEESSTNAFEVTAAEESLIKALREYFREWA